MAVDRTHTWIVIPVHNRCATTLRGLDRLRASGVLEWASVVVVDGGSTDGTADAVRERFPGVHLLRGDDSLWWGGATAWGMRFAAEHGAARFVWLNDDCRPRAGALEAVVDYSIREGCMAVAQAFTPRGVVYGGVRRVWTGLRAVRCGPDECRPCEAFNGNLACIPRAVADRIGYPDAKAFPCKMADTDFGLRATRAGFRAVVVGPALCDNDDNPNAKSWLRDRTPAREIGRHLTTRRGGYYLPAFWRYCLRHWSAWGLVLFAASIGRIALILILRPLIPRRWLGERRTAAGGPTL